MRGARAWVILIILLIAALELRATHRLGDLWALAFGGKGGGQGAGAGGAKK